MPEINTEVVRAFVAIELPEEIKRELARLQESLKKTCRNCPAKWVAAQDIHLTLNFLGDVSVSKLEDIQTALKQTGADSAPFDLGLERLGAFPNLERPHVVWVGLNGDLAGISRLQKNLEHLFEGLGFNPENRPFSPHLTLARVRDEAPAVDVKRLGQAIGSTVCEKNCSIPVRSISLIKSRLTPTGPIYNVLFSAGLTLQS